MSCALSLPLALAAAALSFSFLSFGDGAWLLEFLWAPACARSLPSFDAELDGAFGWAAVAGGLLLAFALAADFLAGAAASLGAGARRAGWPTEFFFKGRSDFLTPT